MLHPLACFAFSLLSFFLMNYSMIYQTASFQCLLSIHNFLKVSVAITQKKLREPSLGNSRLCPHDVILSTHVFLCCKICSHSVQYSTHVCHVLQMFSCFWTVHETIWFIHLSPLNLDCMTTGPFIWHLAPKMLIDPKHKSKLPLNLYLREPSFHTI